MIAMPRRAPIARNMLAVFLDERVRDLRELVPKAIRAADIKATHHVRVTTRRLKAAIDLLEPMLPARSRKRFARSLRALRRTLGPARDADVMIGHLPRLEANARRKAAVEWLRDRLARHREELIRARVSGPKASAILRELDAWTMLSRRIHRSPRAAGSLLGRVAPVRLADFVDQANHVAQLDLAMNPDATEDVHALRVSGKRLRYTLELCEPVGIRLPPAVLRKFKRLQDALGLWHDYAALGEQVLRFALDEQLALHRPGLYGEVLDLARACLRHSNAHLRGFARFWQREGDALAATICEALRRGSAAPVGEPAHGEPAPAPARTTTRATVTASATT
jgi:CHAD domain-containing protein